MDSRIPSKRSGVLARFRVALLAAAALVVAVAHGHGHARVEATRVSLLHYWTGAFSGGISELVEAFNEGNASMRVDASGLEHESFKVGIKGMLHEGRAPDIFSYWAGARVNSLVEAGYLAPIDDVWAESGLNGLFTKTVAQACTYGGRKYAVPVTQHYVAFFYNKKVFDGLGLAPPRTWREFLDVCARLKMAGVTPLALGTRELWPAQFWFDFLLLRTAGPEYRGRLMEGAASFTDPQVERTFALWKALLDEGYFNRAPEKSDWADAARMVREGEAAMTLMGSWIIGLYTGQMGWEEQSGFDFFPFPTIDAGVPQSALGPIDVFVATNGGKAEDSKKALAFFAQLGPQMKMSEGSGAIAPNIRVPRKFYSPLRQRIRQAILDAPHWAFAFDLATPPAVADIGLGTFSAFLRNPDNARQILLNTQKRVESFSTPQPSETPADPKLDSDRRR
ncbi:ABC transporter substrate-binding protein [Fundidesulfovibrio terrae]|uniref:ABC transporter substrate-binding protein n=1 Tax=Fundidesulfovibrio terrae TaxID=2922866 RepID=UPI001FB017ED|nr:extracellular solute-binding protein [Fundidesulfovibrio terrae]